MSVMEMLRGESSSSAGRPDWPSLQRPALAGAGAAAVSAAVFVLPALVVWVSDSHTTVPWTSALGIGASLWLLGGGAHLAWSGGQVTMVPLLFLLLAVLGSTWGAVRAARDSADDRTMRYIGVYLHARLASTLLAWTVGYAVCATLWAAVALAVGPRPVLGTLLLPILVIPVVSALLALGYLVRGRRELAGPGLHRPDWLPDAARRGVRPGLEGASVLLGVGMLACVGMVLLHLSRVSHLQGELSPGLLGAVLLVLGQLAMLPNLGLWAVSFMAGTGFSAVEGASATWTGSRTSLLPMIPVLGALPEPGAFPVMLPAIVVVPVLTGVFVGWRALRSVARLSTARTKLTAVGVAVVVAAGSLGMLDLLGGSSLGVARLSDIGAPSGAMSFALLVEFALGAATAVLWDRWRLRR